MAKANRVIVAVSDLSSLVVTSAASATVDRHQVDGETVQITFSQTKGTEILESALNVTRNNATVRVSKVCDATSQSIASYN